MLFFCVSGQFFSLRFMFFRLGDEGQFRLASKVGLSHYLRDCIYAELNFKITIRALNGPKEFEYRSQVKSQIRETRARTKRGAMNFQKPICENQIVFEA